jgi:hypothetical protein
VHHTSCPSDTAYIAHFQEKNVKKILAVFAVALIAGCSSMGGMGGRTSGASGAGYDSSSSGSAIQFQRQMFDRDGQLSIYHGG